jgi:hypothetical protein
MVKAIPALPDAVGTISANNDATGHYRILTTVAPKPSIVIEQATSSYSFRFSELSQPI